MAQGSGMTATSTSLARPGTGSRRLARGLALLAGTGLLATGCAEYTGSLQHLTGVNTTYCAPAEGFDSIGSTLALHIPLAEEAVTLEGIEPLNAEGLSIRESRVVPTAAEGANGYGAYGPELVAEGRGSWDEGTAVEGAIIEPGQNASLVVHTGTTGEGEEAALEGYRLTYTQDGHEHTITVRQGVEVSAEECPPIEGGGSGGLVAG